MPSPCRLGLAPVLLAAVAASLKAPRATQRSSKPLTTGVGFGAATKPRGGGKRGRPAVSRSAPKAPVADELTDELAAMAANGLGIQNFLNPRLLEDSQTMAEVSRRLGAGEVVVLRDAFRPAFAEAVHKELRSPSMPWTLNEAYYDDGYAFKHHNVYEKRKWSARLNMTLGVFADEATKAWMQELSGRDCSGDVVGAPSYYRPSDHSLPHTDWVGQRTVAYVWHLSKAWRPEWGGALYWAQNPHEAATYPASFNTLVLFSVTTTSAHFVTAVSPHAKEMRLAFNGWWQSAWLPHADEELERRLGTADGRSAVTHLQLQAITDMLADPWQNIAPDRRERIEALRESVMTQFFPRPPKDL